jgi:hypothetical protein
MVLSFAALLNHLGAKLDAILAELRRARGG